VIALPTRNQNQHRDNHPPGQQTRTEPGPKMRNQPPALYTAHAHARPSEYSYRLINQAPVLWFSLSSSGLYHD